MADTPEPDLNGCAVRPFRAVYAAADEELAATFLAAARLDEASQRRIDARAGRLVATIRARAGVGLEGLLQEYALSTKEGLALMVLAEALLRVPDSATADRLIEDKLSAADFIHHTVRSPTLVVSASAWALGLSARIVSAHETPASILDALVGRLGLPAVRTATRQAMRILGGHFVLAETIGEALARAAAHPQFRYSFDMLGEGARTAADARRYCESYAAAIDAIARRAGATQGAMRPGISVKLSALHPRYEATSRGRVAAELFPVLTALARRAAAQDLNFTVDAEEADRLELSLDLFARLVADPDLAGWDGLGLAVQAYQKRAPELIDWVVAAAAATGRRLTVRLVKGAYWDTEIKRAQERGLADYPVFTRKAMTDLCYMACARKLLAARSLVYPQFATHNALTVAGVIEAAGGTTGYEFQRLHGMGEALYAALLAEEPEAACRVYAPVGGHRDLLAYLVRRLLENGANSSFVSVASDPAVPVSAVLERPEAVIGDPRRARHAKIPLPRDLFTPVRANSSGVEFGHQASLDALRAEIVVPRDEQSAPLVDGIVVEGHARAIASPIDGAPLGRVIEGDDAIVTAAMAAAQVGFSVWDRTAIDSRADALDAAAAAFERERGRLIGLLQAEAGKTLDDALAEVREAADFCRYYAAEARRALRAEPLPGPTGERNELCYRGRGVFVCISPWNFPLAIFAGQIAAALAAGNAVVAKPAEQTPLIAAQAVRLLHAAGIAPTALHLVPGDGRIGAALVADRRVAGVAFTGSTEVARSINRALAAKDGPIVPFIAETGGINAMIADATALPEQVTDDVMTSAFRSAGQRCSALRLLCVQDDVADRMIDMVIGAAAELAIGDPRDIATHVGPVIDADAKRTLDAWVERMEERGRLLYRAEAPDLPGTFVPPAIVMLDRARDLDREVFGPVLHLVRFRGEELDQLLADIAGTGYGLTLGIHSRIETTVERIATLLGHGNVYVNRNMIGAVVGVQPFGGRGLSGTGPKAGGPNYVRHFAIEQTVTVNTAAVGGNASLLAETEA